MSEATKESGAEELPDSITPPPRAKPKRKWLRRCGEREARIWMFNLDRTTSSRFETSNRNWLYNG